jgi:copper chaperone CopZ
MSESLSLSVMGMKCGGCESTIKTKLDAIEGVLCVEASHHANKIKIEYQAEQTNEKEITQVIIDVGYHL